MQSNPKQKEGRTRGLCAPVRRMYTPKAHRSAKKTSRHTATEHPQPVTQTLIHAMSGGQRGIAIKEDDGTRSRYEEYRSLAHLVLKGTSETIQTSIEAVNVQRAHQRPIKHDQIWIIIQHPHAKPLCWGCDASLQAVVATCLAAIQYLQPRRKPPCAHVLCSHGRAENKREKKGSPNAILDLCHEDIVAGAGGLGARVQESRV